MRQLDLERPLESKGVSLRERTIGELLNHWPEFFDVPLRSAPGGGGVLMLPGMSRHPSVVELGRALEALQVFAPSKFVHVRGFYSAEWRTAMVWRDLRVKGRKRRIEEPARVRVVPGWVRPQKVRDGVRLLAYESSRPWAFQGVPCLPAPLLERQAGEPKVAA